MAAVGSAGAFDFLNQSEMRTTERRFRRAMTGVVGTLTCLQSLGPVEGGGGYEASRPKPLDCGYRKALMRRESLRHHEFFVTRPEPFPFT